MDARGRTSGSYAACFRVNGQAWATGKVAVEADHLQLDGGREDTPVTLTIAYADVIEVSIGRAPEERFSGRPTIMVASRHGEPVQIAPFGAGILHELVSLLNELARPSVGDQDRVLVRVPLEPGSLPRVRELIAAGPPFDPAVLGLEEHQVFACAGEAVFILRGRGVAGTLARATREPSFWCSGLAWRRLISGPPKVSSGSADDLSTDYERLYTWSAEDGPPPTGGLRADT
jgi:hypothetical protein